MWPIIWFICDKFLFISFFGGKLSPYQNDPAFCLNFFKENWFKKSFEFFLFILKKPRTRWTEKKWKKIFIFICLEVFIEKLFVLFWNFQKDSVKMTEIIWFFRVLQEISTKLWQKNFKVLNKTKKIFPNKIFQKKHFQYFHREIYQKENLGKKLNVIQNIQNSLSHSK